MKLNQTEESGTFILEIIFKTLLKIINLTDVEVNIIKQFLKLSLKIKGLK